MTAAPQMITREIPALELRAMVKAGSVDKEKRTAEVVWTTGARVLRGWWEKFYEELSLDPAHVRMGRLQSGRAPLLDSHNSWSLSSQLGVVERAALGQGEGTATVRFSRRAEVEPIFQDVADGIICNVSVGYRVYKYEKVEDGETTIPVYRAVDWEPYEISPCPAGADAGAGFRSERGGDRATPNPCIFVTRSQESSMKPETPAVPATPPTPPVPAEPARSEDILSRRATDNGDALNAVRAEAAKAERERAEGIRKSVRAARLKDDVADDLIKRGVPLDQARAHILDQLATEDEKIPTTSHVRVGEDAADKWARGATAWLISKAGQTDAVRRAAKALPEHAALRSLDLDPGEFRGMSLLDLARESLERRGVKTRGLDKMNLVATAFTLRSGGMQSTSDFPVLLENVLHKVLLGAYATTPDTWRRFCAIGSVSDFRAHNRYRLGSFGSLDKVNEGGEFRNKAIPDGEKQTISAETRGNIIALTRQAIINDDMGAFTSLATRFGRSAALTIEVLVYALLAENSGLGPTMSDGNTLFHASHSNISTGAALSAVAIDADRVAMASQRDPSGNEILELRPKVLLLPIGLGSTARSINEAQYDPDTANKLQKPNTVRGLFADIVDTARLTGTRRYLFADPNMVPVIEVAFLDGQQEPFLDQQDGWRVDGTEWKVRLDVGVGAVDWRGAITNAGV